MDETRNFFQSYMERIGFDEDFDENIFKEIFTQMDKDNSGTLGRKEMMKFISCMINKA